MSGWNYRLRPAERLDRNFVVCPVCRKPVDLMERYYDIVSMTTRFTIACHREHWYVDITDEIMSQATSVNGLLLILHERLTEAMMPETFSDVQDGPYAAPSPQPEDTKPKRTRKITFE